MAWIERRGETYRVRWRETGGKPQQTFLTLDAAEDFKAAVQRAGNNWPAGWIKDRGWRDQVTSDAPTFADYAHRTITARLRADDRTRADYLSMIRNHLNPVIGDKPIDTLDRFDITAVGQRAISAGRSAKTIANIHALLSSIVAEAVEDEYLRRNIARGAMPDPPDVKTEEMCFLTHAEAALLLEQIPEGVYRDLARLLFGTGLRWSEATALQVRDVDLLDTKALQVRRAWKYRDGLFVLGEPKTKRSRRTVSLSSELVDTLTSHAASLTEERFLFVTDRDRPVRHSNFYNRIWLPAVFAAQNCPTHRPDAAAALHAHQLEVRSAKRAGREPALDRPGPCGCPGTFTKTPRIHDARHTHASWLLAEKITLPAIQRRLGHESIQTTIDRYSHLAPEHVDEINAAVDKALARR